MYMLLHWEGIFTVPSGRVTLGKGLPEATIAAPLVHLYASAAVHSA